MMEHFAFPGNIDFAADDQSAFSCIIHRRLLCLLIVCETMSAIHSTQIPTGPSGKSGPPQKVDPFFRNLSGWTEPIH